MRPPGRSAYQNHALVPHEAYQAIYAAGEQDKIFAGYKIHIISTATKCSTERLNMDTSLTTLREEDIDKHMPVAQSWSPALS